MIAEQRECRGCDLQHSHRVAQIAQITPRKTPRVQNTDAIGVQHGAAEQEVRTIS